MHLIGLYIYCKTMYGVYNVKVSNFLCIEDGANAYIKSYLQNRDEFVKLFVITLLLVSYLNLWLFLCFFDSH